MASHSRVLTDHDEIREWAEERGAKPACVQRTGQGEIGMIRLEFPGAPNANDANLDEIGWDDFFRKFDESELALLVQDELASGGRSNFNKLIGRETASAAEQGEKTSRRAKKGQGIAKGRSNGARGGATKKSSATKSAGKSAGKRSSAKKSGAKKSAAKSGGSRSGAKKTSSRSSAKKSSAKKTSGKKSTSRSSAKKSTGSRSTGRSSAKKSSAKKSSAKKSSGTRSAAKKTLAKAKMSNAGGRMQVRRINAPRGAEIDIKTRR